MTLHVPSPKNNEAMVFLHTNLNCTVFDFVLFSLSYFSKGIIFFIGIISLKVISSLKESVLEDEKEAMRSAVQINQ